MHRVAMALRRGRMERRFGRCLHSACTQTPSTSQSYSVLCAQSAVQPTPGFGSPLLLNRSIVGLASTSLHRRFLSQLVSRTSPTTGYSHTQVQRHSHRLAMAPLIVTSPAAAAANFGLTDAQLSKQLIYCRGSLLDAVQQSKLFHDCKHFVDMPLRTDPSSTLEDWQNLVNSGAIDELALKSFVERHFEEPGGELDEIQPIDFNPDCKFDAISCPSYRQWAQELHRKWPQLCRKVSDKVLAEPHRFSLIALPKPFVVPGGRFREMYYWDSFFTMKGLLASGMYQTVRGMIENMGHLIDQFGYIPNGNRVYYLNRSQPPVLTWCLLAYYEATGDKEFVLAGMKWIEKEMQFFQNKKSIQLTGVSSMLYRYHVVADCPRPESYREDVESAHHIENMIEKHRLWGDIAAAAESGRDFSSRWFSDEGPEAGKMGSTRTSSILPVDLNAIICGNWNMMCKLYEAIGDSSSAELCRRNFEAMKEAIHQVFWNDDLGCWFDYDISTGCHIKVYQDTNFFPLFTGSTHNGFDATAVVNYLEHIGALGFPGGLPSSLVSSGQQWDFPNAWAPTTWVVIQGLRANGQQELARQIADKWIRKNYNMWLISGGHMYEKYNVATACFKAVCGGGEYEVQEGFGWTNGVILDLLATYGAEVSYHPQESDIDCSCCKHVTLKVECKLQ